MKIRNLAIAAVALLMPFTAAACGGADSTSELDKGDLSKELQKSGMPEAQADCAADALIKSDFTKDEIDKMNAGDSGVDKAKVKEFTAAMVKCVGVGGS